MDLTARRELQVLETLAANEEITQRSLAAKVGIALGLANLCIKRLVRKGFVKCVNVQSNRILYLITPQGILEKSRLAYEYVDYSLHVYREVREHLRAVLQPLITSSVKAIAIYGTGEAAELAYLSIKELGLEPTAVFDGGGDREFLGMPVHHIRDHSTFAYDLLVVATFAKPSPVMRQLVDLGVSPAKLISLRPDDTSQSIAVTHEARVTARASRKSDDARGCNPKP